MSTLLIVDDDWDFGATLALGLRAEGFDVIRRSTGETGIDAIRTDRPDLLLLDLGLPGIDGIEVLTQLRGWSSIPIVVLSSREDEATKIRALEGGADDYVTKPFSIGELSARVRAALRRGIKADGNNVIEANGLRIDLEAKSVTKAGTAVRLTATEWRLLAALAAREGQVVDHKTLLVEVWGPEATTSVEYLRVYVSALRRKIEGDPSSPNHLLNVAGLGYQFQR